MANYKDLLEYKIQQEKLGLVPFFNKVEYCFSGKLYLVANS